MAFSLSKILDSSLTFLASSYFADNYLAVTFYILKEWFLWTLLTSSLLCMTSVYCLILFNICIFYCSNCLASSFSARSFISLIFCSFLFSSSYKYLILVCSCWAYWSLRVLWPWISWIVIIEYRSLLFDFIWRECGDDLWFNYKFWEENTDGLWGFWDLSSEDEGVFTFIRRGDFLCGFWDLRSEANECWGFVSSSSTLPTAWIESVWGPTKDILDWFLRPESFSFIFRIWEPQLF